VTLRLVVRSLAARPVRFAVLSCGFGFGVAVMAALLGVGDVVLEQAQSPALLGGGEITVTGSGGAIDHARFVLASVLGSDPIAKRVEVASPAARRTVYLVDEDGVTPVRATGGIPSLERALGDPEVAAPRWTDSAADREWIAPDPAGLLRGIDRFHEIPDVPARAGSWAEWWYFNGRSSDGRVGVYLTFLAGPRTPEGKRSSFVRLQLLRGDRSTSWSRGGEVAESALPTVERPAIEIAGSRAALEGLRYEIDLDLDGEQHGGRLRGRMSLDASSAKSVPPLTLEGASGWVSGYVVPVLSGTLDGTLAIGSETISLEGFVGYHDHNWGFWKGVTWQWGQVAHDDLSFVYGRIRPPEDAADPARVPGLLVVMGPEGPLAVATGVRITERDAPGRDRPERIEVEAQGSGISLALTVEVEDAIRTRMARTAPDAGGVPTFLQLRGRYRGKGTVAGRTIDFEAPGSAETFRSE
jgi:hypothetical protein